MKSDNQDPRSNVFGFSFLTHESTKTGHTPVVRIVGMEENVRQSIITILATEQGERSLCPTFGSRLRSFMFRKNDGQLHQKIRNHVFQVLRACEERAEFEEVEVQKDAKLREQLNIIIRYRLRETGTKQSVVYPMNVFE